MYVRVCVCVYVYRKKYFLYGYSQTKEKQWTDNYFHYWQPETWKHNLPSSHVHAEEG